MFVISWSELESYAGLTKSSFEVDHNYFKSIKMQGFDEEALKREKKTKPKIRKQFLSERKDGKKVHIKRQII